MPPKLYGGIERIVAGLIHELRTRKHFVGLVAHAESTCSVDYFRPWPQSARLGHVHNAINLSRAVRAFRPDLVHSFSRLAYLATILPRRLPKIMSYQRHTGGKQIKIAGWLAGKSIAFTGCSEFIAGMGRSWGSEWTVIPNFVDLNFYRFKARVPDDSPLVFLSRIERIKGAHTAIAIARRTRRKLILAGNRVTHEEGEAYWRQEIEPFLNKDGIEYIGPVDDQQKNDLLGAAAALILPIEWHEPFGIVFAEALACGTPVISSPRGAVPEIVRHGVDGFLVEDVEEACKAVDNIGTLRRSDCRQRVAELFSSETVVSQYLNLYRRRIEVLERAQGADRQPQVSTY